MQGKLIAENDEQIRRAREMGHDDINEVLTLDKLVSGEDVMFVATGVTTGDVLRGIEKSGDFIKTHSVVLRSKTETVRFLETAYKVRQK